MEIGGRGAPLHTVEGAFLAFDVPAGVSRIRLKYRPLSYYGSLIVALVGFIGLILWNTRWGSTVVRRPVTGNAVL